MGGFNLRRRKGGKENVAVARRREGREKENVGMCPLLSSSINLVEIAIFSPKEDILTCKENFALT